MSKIFISYRKTDSGAEVGRIYDYLESHFGQDLVFKDVNNIPYGVDFRKYLEQSVSQCEILLAVIGEDWLNAKDSEGSRCLDNPTDWVRIEIESALKRDIPVIPLLLTDTKMPAISELPEGLKDLAYRNGAKIRNDPDFHHDMDNLISQIKQAFGDKEEEADYRNSESYSNMFNAGNKISVHKSQIVPNGTIKQKAQNLNERHGNDSITINAEQVTGNVAHNQEFKDNSGNVNVGEQTSPNSVTGNFGADQKFSNHSGNINVGTQSDSGGKRWSQTATIIGIIIALLTLIATVTVPESRCFLRLDSPEKCSD
ncbi:MAG: toll/interleukin-1 receptor domain-containing protein [Cyanobacteria bacterium P01_B01_bin.77]